MIYFVSNARMQITLIFGLVFIRFNEIGFGSFGLFIIFCDGFIIIINGFFSLSIILTF
jgi:hypothetical protein